jgi:hypothetical protein
VEEVGNRRLTAAVVLAFVFQRTLEEVARHCPVAKDACGAHMGLHPIARLLGQSPDRKKQVVRKTVLLAQLLAAGSLKMKMDETDWTLR